MWKGVEPESKAEPCELCQELSKQTNFSVFFPLADAVAGSGSSGEFKPAWCWSRGLWKPWFDSAANWVTLNQPPSVATVFATSQPASLGPAEVGLGGLH